MCKMAIYYSSDLALQSLHLLNQPDGAGFYSVPKGILVKDVNFEPEDFKPMVNEDAVPLIVHSRRASSGSDEDNENVQPMKFGHNVLAHNGTIAKSELSASKFDVNDRNLAEKILAYKRRSDSSLLAESLASDTLAGAEKKLSQYQDNFILYNEVEEKFLVMGRFQLYEKQGNALALLVTTTRFENLKRLKGTLLLSKEGRILRQETEQMKEEKEAEISGLRDYWSHPAPARRKYCESLEGRKT